MLFECSSNLIQWKILSFLFRNSTEIYVILIEVYTENPASQNRKLELVLFRVAVPFFNTVLKLSKWNPYSRTVVADLK